MNEETIKIKHRNFEAVKDYLDRGYGPADVQGSGIMKRSYAGGITLKSTRMHIPGGNVHGKTIYRYQVIFTGEVDQEIKNELIKLAKNGLEKQVEGAESKWQH